MAVRKLEKASQPFLEALDIPEPTFKTTDFAMPKIDDIDLTQVRIYLDLDLDELTTHFADRLQPYDIEDCSPYGQLLVDGDSDEVVGVNISRFLTTALRRHPDLASALKFATVITGDRVVSNPIADTEFSDVVSRDLRAAVAASMEALLAG